MSRTGLLSALAFFALAGVCGAAIINVPDDQQTIQAGIDASQNGDTVLVQPGTYVEIINFGGRAIAVASLFLTTGDAAYIDSTIIDGDANGHSVVVMRNGETRDALLTGFTITNGSTDYGGGIYIRDSFPTISHVVVTDCHASRVGGGIYCTMRAAPVIGQAVITANTAGIGGGGFGCYNYCEPVLVNCAVSGNTTNIDGGGLWVGMLGQILLQDTDISDNHADGNGGGIYSSREEAVTTIINCLITGNESGSDGGGICCSSNGDISAVYTLITANHAEGAGGAVYFTGTQASFTNVTFANNSSSNRSEIYIANDVTLDLRNCIIWNVDDWAILGVGTPQEVTVNYCDLHNGENGIDVEDDAVVNWGDGNIDDDPRFFNADSGDYHLSPDSPCIDTGDPDSPLDPDSTRADMGALHFHYSGSIKGYVYDSLEGWPIPDVFVFTNLGNGALTDYDGFYQLTNVLMVAETTLTARCADFIDSVVTGFHIGLNDTAEVNFRLWHPIPAISDEGFSLTLASGDSAVREFSLANEGNYPLVWSLEKQMRDEPEPWTRIASYSVGEQVRDTRIQGVAYAQGKIYVAGGGNVDEPDEYVNYIYVLNRDGELTDRFAQPCSTRYGLSDLEWDGELLWGSGERRVYGFTTEGEMVSAWDGPSRFNPAIAWDSNRELLWIASINSNYIVGCNRNGDSLAELNQDNFRIRGLAYCPTDPDGYNLYIFHSPDLEAQVIHKMNTETGDTMFVAILHPNDGGSPRGCYITSEYEPLNWVFLSVVDDGSSDRIDAWFMDADPYFVIAEPDSGCVQPIAEAQEIALRISSVGLDSGEYNAFIELDFPEIHTRSEVSLQLIISPNKISDFGFRVLDFGLGEAYPNPFNAVAVVSYQLSVISPARLALYDLSGRLVQTLVDDYQSAGEHRATINGAGLASGVYFLKLAAGNRIATRKIVCVK